jgi:hypothetical protein
VDDAKVYNNIDCVTILTLQFKPKFALTVGRSVFAIHSIGAAKVKVKVKQSHYRP